jgi:hypothetical protein
MSHTHFCDYAGHVWECNGAAILPLAGHREPSPCFCLRRQVPMENRDHSQCSIELLACPEHLGAKLQAMATTRADRQPDEESTSGSGMFLNKEGKPIIGFCLWCDKDFYSMDEVEAHNADDLGACPSYQRWKTNPEAFTE